MRSGLRVAGELTSDFVVGGGVLIPSFSSRRIECGENSSGVAIYLQGHPHPTDNERTTFVP